MKELCTSVFQEQCMSPPVTRSPTALPEPRVQRAGGTVLPFSSGSKHPLVKKLTNTFTNVLISRMIRMTHECTHCSSSTTTSCPLFWIITCFFTLDDYINYSNVRNTHVFNSIQTITNIILVFIWRTMICKQYRPPNKEQDVISYLRTLTYKNN